MSVDQELKDKTSQELSDLLGLITELGKFFRGLTRSFFERLLVWLVIGNFGAIGLIITGISGNELLLQNAALLRLPIILLVLGACAAFVGMTMLTYAFNAAWVAMAFMEFVFRAILLKNAASDETISEVETLIKEKDIDTAKERLEHLIKFSEGVDTVTSEFKDGLKISWKFYALLLTPFAFIIPSGILFVVGMIITINTLSSISLII